MKVEYVDHLGTDLSPVNAARVSFDKISTELDDKDEKLISYLAKHDHWSPFAHTAVTLRLTMPVFVARQLMKHTVGFSWNEVSRRYVDTAPEFYTPDTWRKRADNVKQGSSDETVDLVEYGEECGGSWERDPYRDALDDALWTYNYLLDRGVAPEQARMILPQSMYTQTITTASVLGWTRLYNQRSDKHAQKEAQDVALLVRDIVEPLFPVSWKELTK